MERRAAGFDDAARGGADGDRRRVLNDIGP
jgi:hypothetical protein